MRMQDHTYQMLQRLIIRDTMPSIAMAERYFTYFMASPGKPVIQFYRFCVAFLFLPEGGMMANAARVIRHRLDCDRGGN